MGFTSTKLKPAEHVRRGTLQRQHSSVLELEIKYFLEHPLVISVKPLDTTAQTYTYLWTHVFVAPVCSVGLGVGFQDVVQIIAFRRWLHVAIQNGRCADVPGVEPADGQSSFNGRNSSLDQEQKLNRRAGRRVPHVLAVGVFALDQVGSLQRNTGKQSSGSAVGEDRRCAAERNVRLDIPGREKEKGKLLSLGN